MLRYKNKIETKALHKIAAMVVHGRITTALKFQDQDFGFAPMYGANRKICVFNSSYKGMRWRIRAHHKPEKKRREGGMARILSMCMSGHACGCAAIFSA
jgi:hypothetical protein